jgi:hypothetical protein
MNACPADSGAVQVLRERRERRRMRRERNNPVLARPRNSLLRRRSRCPPRVDNVTHWIRYHELKFCLNARRSMLMCADLLLTITTAPCTERTGCTDNTGNRTDSTRRAGITCTPFHDPFHARGRQRSCQCLRQYRRVVAGTRRGGARAGRCGARASAPAKRLSASGQTLTTTMPDRTPTTLSRFAWSGVICLSRHA